MITRPPAVPCTAMTTPTPAPAEDATSGPAPGEPGGGPPKNSGGIYWLIAIGLLVAVCTISGIVKANSGTGSDGGADKYVAQSMCEDFVGRQLKAPATAKYEHTSTVLEGGVWVDLGTVDSENSFGALIRSAFTCRTSVGADGTTWTPLGVTVG